MARPEGATSSQPRATPWVNAGGAGRPERAKAEKPDGSFALSGRTSSAHYTQGVALGLPLVALSGRLCTVHSCLRNLNYE